MEAPYQLVVIGAGLLGSRHVQSLKSCRHACHLYIVDSQQASLDKTRSIYESTDVPECRISQVHYCLDMENLPPVIDFLLISTGSKPRAAIFKSLASKHTIKAVLFEKVLFQKETDYPEIAAILREKGIPAWVNCPRRMFPGYRELQPLFAGKSATMTITGGLWGMACNAIHILDIFSFLTGSKLETVDTSALDPRMIESKRPGYQEFTGTLIGHFSNKGTVILHSIDAPVTDAISIVTPEIACYIDESSRKYWIRTAETDEIHPFPVPYQSQLTSTVADAILDGAPCPLPTFAESSALHLPLIKGLIEFINLLGIDTDICPIT